MYVHRSPRFGLGEPSFWAEWRAANGFPMEFTPAPVPVSAPVPMTAPPSEGVSFVFAPAQAPLSQTQIVTFANPDGTISAVAIPSAGIDTRAPELLAPQSQSAIDPEPGGTSGFNIAEKTSDVAKAGLGRLAMLFLLAFVVGGGDD